MITLGVIIFPVLQGKVMKPEVIFPALPLIRLFVETFVMKAVTVQALRIGEMLVTANRLEVKQTLSLFLEVF